MIGLEGKTLDVGLFVCFSPPGFGMYSFKDWSSLLVASRTNQLNYTQEMTLVHTHTGEKAMQDKVKFINGYCSHLYG